MIRHVVMWKFRSEHKEQVMQEVQDRLAALRPIIPEILAMEIGRDLKIGRDAYDMALVTLFEHEEALKIYQQHPEHRKVSAYVAENKIARAAVDYPVEKSDEHTGAGD